MNQISRKAGIEASQEPAKAPLQNDEAAQKDIKEEKNHEKS